MYIHIGAEVSIPFHWIVGIFDMEQMTERATDTVALMARAERDGRLEWMTEDIPRSLIVAVDRVYLSPVSAHTLRQRCHYGSRYQQKKRRKRYVRSVK